MSERICRRCNESKELAEFQKCKRSLGGHVWVCKSCTSKRKKAWKEKNREEIREKDSLYRLENVEKRAKYNYKYHREHKEERAASGKKWQEENKESNKIKSKIYRDKNRSRRYQYELKYREENKDKILAYREIYKPRYRQYIKDKRKNDPNFRIACALRGRFKTFLKYKGIKPNIKTLELIGCDLDFFKKYIESQFKEGMSWDNHGLNTWHLDHIIPLSSFDLTKESEQFKAMNYTNFQPLFAKENLIKNDRLDWSLNE